MKNPDREGRGWSAARDLRLRCIRNTLVIALANKLARIA